MKSILEWLKPGAKIKRYIFTQLLFIALLIFSGVTLFTRDNLSISMLIAFVILISVSIFMIFFSFIMAQKNILEITLKSISKNENTQSIKKLLYDDNQLKKGPKVVMIGGGSGLSNILRGLKQYTSNITAVVTTFDDGGSTGKLRSTLEVVAPGDIRKCITALSTSEPTMEKLLSYRFSNGNVDNHALGNLFLVAMTEITGSFQSAIEKISDIFSVKGKVLPVTLENMTLCAGLENGEVVTGEASIQPKCLEAKSAIKQVFLKQATGCKAAPGVLDAIKDADIVVFGPGSLYTSVICNFLVDEVSSTIIKSKAKKMYVCNLMTQPGETDGYSVAKHVNEIERYIGQHVLDYCVVNNGEITDEMLVEFNQGTSTPVRMDLENIQNRTISVVQKDLVVTAKNSILHNNEKVAEIIVDAALASKPGNLNLLKKKKDHKKKAKEMFKLVSEELEKIKNKKNTTEAKTKKENKAKKEEKGLKQEKEHKEKQEKNDKNEKNENKK
ncbi:MAG: YvcK family protein [Clostridia bacterium]